MPSFRRTLIPSGSGNRVLTSKASVLRNAIVMRGYTRTVERYVAEILDHEPVHTAFGERSSIREHEFPDFFEAHRAAWRSRQGGNVNHPDYWLTPSKHPLRIERIVQ